VQRVLTQGREYGHFVQPDAHPIFLVAGRRVVTFFPGDTDEWLYPGTDNGQILRLRPA
jgi:hypothetical protein